MKKLAFSALFLSLTFTLSAGVARAQTNMCNVRCDVDSDCGSGYRCYVGVCRLDACPASASCNCASTAGTTPVPTSTPVATATPTLQPTASASARPTNTPIATVSALSSSPKTGFESWIFAGLGLVLLGIGSSLSRADRAVFDKGTTPLEILSKRKSNQGR